MGKSSLGYRQKKIALIKLKGKLNARDMNYNYHTHWICIAEKWES